MHLKLQNCCYESKWNAAMARVAEQVIQGSVLQVILQQ